MSDTAKAAARAPAPQDHTLLALRAPTTCMRPAGAATPRLGSRSPARAPWHWQAELSRGHCCTGCTRHLPESRAQSPCWLGQRELTQAQKGHRVQHRDPAPVQGSHHTGQGCCISLENLALLTHQGPACTPQAHTSPTAWAAGLLANKALLHTPPAETQPPRTQPAGAKQGQPTRPKALGAAGSQQPTEAGAHHGHPSPDCQAPQQLPGGEELQRG